MARKLTYLILSCFFTLVIEAQDLHFSQFYANPLYLGPSFAGAVEGSRIAGQYRSQWYGMDSPFRAYSFSFDHYFSTFNSGLGVNFLSDMSGSASLGSYQVGVHYSYDLKVFNIWHIRPGLSFSYLQHGIYGNIIFMDDIFNEEVGSTTTTGTPSAAFSTSHAIDGATSLLIYTYDFWVGATVDHLLTPNISLYGTEATIPLKTSIYAGYDFRRKGKLLKPSDEVLTFSALYKQQLNVRQLDLGASWYNEPLLIGICYRGIPVVNSERGDAIVFVAGIKTRQFNVGYSYDFTVSNMLRYAQGSHEISFAYKFNLPKRIKKGGVPCPEF